MAMPGRRCRRQEYAAENVLLTKKRSADQTEKAPAGVCRRGLTISYDLNDAAAENRLKNCTTEDADFYNADTRDELVGAFSTITTKLARAMYLSE